MDIRKINDSISVSPQIRLDDTHELARLGFRSIISSRPDGEEDGQPNAESICMAAAGAGLEFRHIPVIASSITPLSASSTTGVPSRSTKIAGAVGCSGIPSVSGPFVESSASASEVPAISKGT